MPHPLAPIVQSLVALSLPLALAVLPGEGAMRTVAFTPVPTAAILNAVIDADGRIVAGGTDGSFIVSGRRDRLFRALLPLGVLALPTASILCGGRSA